MCGIAGVVALHGDLDPLVAAAVPRMTRALSHRGPDAEGHVASAGAVLGHRRLSVIDVGGGVQPMSNEDGSVWVVFNGEIYNHASLRERLLGLGHQFRTKSDTEAIVHAYEQFGPACLDHLFGMFAFAIYDRRTRELFVARDRLGKKPLFYAVLGGVLHFASEMKALFASPSWRGEPDHGQLETFLSLGYILAPATAYRGVRKLEPGHWLRVNNGRIETRKYWDVERFDDFGEAEDSAVAAIDEQLQARVTERLESDVPIGAFLSGGIDSGLVVSYMAGAMSRPVDTTTVGFGESAHNELSEAGFTATRFATDHHTHIISPQLDEVFEQIVDAFDEPFADSSSIPTFYVSREARRHVTVALSGDGGDEAFGGYDFRYVPHGMEARVRAGLPGSVVRRAVGEVGQRWPRGGRVPRPLRLGTFLENIGGQPEAAYYSDLCFLKPAMTRRLLGRPAPRDLREMAAYDAVTTPYLRCPSTHPVQKAQYADLKVYLPNDVLVKVDRMSMQHSLEVRSPMLDHRIIELAFQLPQSLKRADRTGKHLLKRIAQQRLPPELLRVRKRGFTAPIGEWIAGPYAARYVEQVLSPHAAIAAVLDQSVLRRWFEEQQRNTQHHGYALWAAWVLERWLTVQSAQQQASLQEVRA
jgi:asparagine synthase (glutamine-hydrolysing)